MSERQFPALFIGHGSPMNVLADNDYTKDLHKLAKSLPLPGAVVVISAHWLSRGTKITAGVHPEQIYDFYGFPDELYEVIYRAPGLSELASEIVSGIGNDHIVADASRGIDHAAWAVLRHMYPDQTIPVLELSLDMGKSWKEHFELGKSLSFLRSKQVLMIGSGNIVHNLGDLSWIEPAPSFPWAVEFDHVVRSALVSKDTEKLLDFDKLGPMAKRAIPTDEHYLPMLYILGMMDDGEDLQFVHESMQNGSISMRSFQVG